MPTQLATIMCFLLIIYLFWFEREKVDGVSGSIWIPYIWMFFAGSRYVSQWLGFGGVPRSEEAYLDGSPIDRAIFSILIAVAIFVLARRKINWGLIIKDNIMIWIYFLYCLISVIWSDYPFVSIKRLLKTLGTLSMALIILTEERPYEALGVILRRLSFVLLPLSVLFIKYYPHLGRTYHQASGVALFTGVTTQKNSLGAICLLFGIYFLWDLLYNRWENNRSEQRRRVLIYLILLPMIAWLLYMSNSATSLACMFVAIGLFLVGKQPAVAKVPQRIVILLVAFSVLFVVLEISFGVKETIFSILDRRPDLTTRVPMWEDLLSMAGNPLVGVGYDSFWLGERQTTLIEKWNLAHNAHNGYLEIYLNLGLVGLVFMLGWILSGLKKVSLQLIIDYQRAILKLCIVVVVALYNYTEAVLYGINNIWMIFLFATLVAQVNSPLFCSVDRRPNS